MGPNSLYELTWHEIWRLLKGARLRLLAAQGVRAGDLKQMDEVVESEEKVLEWLSG